MLLNKELQIYIFTIAERYRKGAASCSGCRLRYVCGGCMAITNGADKDYFNETNSYCFMSDEDQQN